MYKLFFYNLIVMSMFNFGHPVTPLMLESKQVYDGLNSILYGFFSIASFCFAPYWGKYISKNGVKKLLVFMPFFYAAAQILFCFSEAAILMISARFISGIFAVAFIIAITAYVGKISNIENKAKNFGLIMVSSSIGGICGQILIGVLSIYISGYYFAFILQFVIGIFIIGVGSFFLDSIEMESKSNQKYFFKISPFHILIVLISSTFTMYSCNIGYYMTQVFSVTSMEVALINCFSSIIILFGNIYLINKMDKYLSIRNCYLLQIIVAIFSLLAIIVLGRSNSILFIFFISIFIVSMSVYRPLSQKYVTMDKNKNHSIELSNIASCNALGMVLGSFIGGIAYAVNPNLPFIVMLFLSVLAFVFHRKEKYDKF